MTVCNKCGTITSDVGYVFCKRCGNSLTENPPEKNDELISDRNTFEDISNSNDFPIVELLVDSAYPDDQGGGKVRLDPETMLLLKISPGDLVAIEGKRWTVVKVWRALVEDWSQRKARIDNFTRHNAGVVIGDTVKLIKISDEVEAKRVVLTPPEDLPKKIQVANNPHVINGLIDFPVSMNDSVPIMMGLPFLQPQIVVFKVVEIEPEEAVIITKNTTIEFSDTEATGFFEEVKPFSYEDIGGLREQIYSIREIIELYWRHPEIFDRLGARPPKGILLFGPSGTGKTLLAKIIASESGAHFIYIAGCGDINVSDSNDNAKRLYELFEEAKENAPSIIFIDELESISSCNDPNMSHNTCSAVTQLLNFMDGFEKRGEIIVIGATRRIDLINPELRRSGRFDREIEIGIPNESERMDILNIHIRSLALADDVNIETLAQKTDGFVGADLAALVQEAAIQSFMRYAPDLDLSLETIPYEVLETLRINASDFQNAINLLTKKLAQNKNTIPTILG